MKYSVIATKQNKRTFSRFKERVNKEALCAAWQRKLNTKWHKNTFVVNSEQVLLTFER